MGGLKGRGFGGLEGRLEGGAPGGDWALSACGQCEQQWDMNASCPARLRPVCGLVCIAHASVRKILVSMREI